MLDVTDPNHLLALAATATPILGMLLLFQDRMTGEGEERNGTLVFEIMALTFVPSVALLSFLGYATPEHLTGGLVGILAGFVLERLSIDT